MIGDDLPGDNRVVHYVRPDYYSDGIISKEAFQLRETENGLSVNWLEWFEGLTRSEQLDQVRRLIRLKIAKTGQFAELEVDETIQCLKEKRDKVRFVHKPLDATDEFEADGSHSEIEGLPPREEAEQSSLIGAMIAQHCVKALYPAHNRG